MSIDTQNHYIPTTKGHNNIMKPCLGAPRQSFILEPDTISMMWTPVVSPNKSKPRVGYGMGWIVRDGSSGTIGGKDQPFYAAHSGGAVGASSVLVIMPAENATVDSFNNKDVSESRVELKESDVKKGVCMSKVAPQGVVVAVLFNLQEVTNVTSLGVQIAENFLKVIQVEGMIMSLK